MSVFRFDGSINSAGLGQAVQGVQVYVLTQPANTSVFPPTPLATIYSDSAGLVPLANPVLTDGNGNYFFYAASGLYTFYYHDPLGRIPDEIFPDQTVSTSGGGTLTSVGLAMPADFSVAGSPVTTSGTITVTKTTQNANLVNAGPTSGGAATPTWRKLVSADLPSGVGTVTSVTLAISASALFTASISGTNPITASGTFTINLAFANQAANTFLAGPGSGGSGAITARPLVAGDFAGKTSVTFSTTPVFDASLLPFAYFALTLTGDVASSTITNLVTGQRVIFQITQDGTGNRAFVFPAICKGASAIAPDAGYVSTQEFVYDGTNLRALSAGMVTAS